VVVAEGGGGNEALEGVSGVGKLRQSEGHLGKRRWETEGYYGDWYHFYGFRRYVTANCSESLNWLPNYT
jgi:hypothetical protein